MRNDMAFILQLFTVFDFIYHLVKYRLIPHEIVFYDKIIKNNI